MSSIRKRSWTTPKGEKRDAWRVRYVDNEGKGRTRQFDRKREAEVFRTKVDGEVAAGIHTPDTASITIDEACDLWIKTAEANGRERSTIKQYREWTELHIKPLIGFERLSRLSMPRVEAFKDELLKTRSPAMAGKAVRGLSSIIAEAQRRGLVAQNVAKGVKVVRSKRDRKKITIPAREELRAIIETAGPNFRPLLMTVIFTGLRSSEVRALRREDVDLKNGRITIQQRADQWGVIGSPKSEAGHRRIPIAPALVSELRAWMLRSPPSQQGLLFPNTRGGVRLHSNMLNREYWPLQLKVGLTRKGRGATLRARYDFHALRHAAASAWIRQGVDLKRLTTWLGHSSVQITIDRYGHLIEDELGDAAIVAAAQADLMG